VIVEERVIPSRRGQLLIQSIAIAVSAVGLGFAAESWRVLRSSPLGEVGESLGLPVIAIVVVAVGIWLAITLVRDSWEHRVVLGAESLTIDDSLGSYTVPYGNIDKVQSVPLGGVVIGFRDREQWLAQTRDAAKMRRQSSDVLRGTYGADVLISKKQLALDAEEFIALLRERASSVSGAPLS
jgi:hypothetical protein